MNQPSLWERLAERQQSPTRPASGTNDVAPAQDVAPLRPQDVASSLPHDVASPRSQAGVASSRLIGRRYRLGDRIGRGKFGPIYSATDEGRRDLGIEARVAVQLIDERFARDTRMAAELTSAYTVLSANVHPNIVRTIEFVRDGRTLFLVTELLEGLSLDAVLEEVAPEPLPFEEAAAVLTAVGDALRNLHAKGFVYGPLKLKNVFVTFDYGVKLLDVAPVSPPVSLPYYVEDVGKQPVSRHSTDDVFELACLAYQMLSGRHPFNENSPIEARRVGLEPQPLANLDPQRWQAIARGLALERAGRTHTVQRFLEELAIRGNERIRTTQGATPAAAPSRSAPQRTRMWEASRQPDGELGVFDTLPLQPLPRRRPSLATIARSLFGVAVVVTLGGFALLYYGDLRDSATELLALVDQKLPVQRPAAPASVNGATDPARADTRPESAGPPPATAAATERAPAAGSTAPVADTTPSASAAGESATAGPLSRGSTAPASPEPRSPSTSGSPETSASSAPPLPEGSVRSSTPSTSPAQKPSSSPRAPALPPAAVSSNPTPTAASGAAPPQGAQVSESAPLATRRPAENESSSSAASAASAGVAGSRARAAAAPPGRSSNTAAAKPASPEFPFAFAAPTMTVSEKDKLARIEVRRLGPTDASSSVVWWLSNATASEDNDYGKLGQHTEFFARGEESRTLYIPLIDDKETERTESFYVHLGRYSPQKKHLDALASVRIDIVDDD